MVVVFDDYEKAAKLSLRQMEILAKLDAIVDDISSDCPCQYVSRLNCCSSYKSVVFLCQNFILNMGDTCWNQHLGRLTRDPFQISYLLKVICDTGEILSRSRLLEFNAVL